MGRALNAAGESNTKVAAPCVIHAGSASVFKPS
jgi:hypothetical protein